MIPLEKAKVRIKFISPVLGSAPNSEDIYNSYLRTKLLKEIAKVEKKIEKEKKKKKKKNEDELKALQDQFDYLNEQLAKAPDLTDEEEQKKTIFYRDEEGYPVIRSHQIQGFIKARANEFKEEFGIKGFKDKISRYVRVEPMEIPIYFDGERIEENDLTELQRPIKAWLPSGQTIVSISVSEMLDDGAEIEFELIVLKNAHFDLDTVLSLLEYGKYTGIGQWHTGGYGKFEILEIKKEGK